MEWLHVFVVAVFVFAGFIKGVIGLGLPMIAMGLLALVMSPLQAAAILLVPSFATNLWQMLAGPQLRSLTIRLWPMQLGVVSGTLSGAGWMAGADARTVATGLGIALTAYAILGLSNRQFSVPEAAQPWAGPLVGFVTGLVTAATGVFSVPAVPYLQAIGLEKEQLVQALGLSFTVSTLALGALIVEAGGIEVGQLPLTGLSMIAAIAGVILGQALRRRLRPAVFRRWFYLGLLILGLALAARGQV